MVTETAGEEKGNCAQETRPRGGISSEHLATNTNPRVLLSPNGPGRKLFRNPEGTPRECDYKPVPPGVAGLGMNSSSSSAAAMPTGTAMATAMIPASTQGLDSQHPSLPH